MHNQKSSCSVDSLGRLRAQHVIYLSENVPRLQKLRTFHAQPWFVQVWAGPTWVLLGIARFLVLTVSFRHIAQRLGGDAGLNAWVPLASPVQEQRAVQIRRTIALVAKNTPWTSNCFAQAIAARVLLGVYGVPYMLYFGTRLDPQRNEMQAHAWVAAGRVPVSGGRSFDTYTVVRMFAPADLARADR